MLSTSALRDKLEKIEDLQRAVAFMKNPRKVEIECYAASKHYHSWTVDEIDDPTEVAAVLRPHIAKAEAQLGKLIDELAAMGIEVSPFKMDEEEDDDD